MTTKEPTDEARRNSLAIESCECNVLIDVSDSDVRGNYTDDPQIGCHGDEQITVLDLRACSFSRCRWLDVHDVVQPKIDVLTCEVANPKEDRAFLAVVLRPATSSTCHKFGHRIELFYIPLHRDAAEGGVLEGVGGFGAELAVFVDAAGEQVLHQARSEERRVGKE